MTETLLAFATDYGLYVVFFVVFIAALGVPLPASILVLTSGGLASTGDILLIELFLFTLSAYILGDQAAYQLGKIAGPNLIEKLSSHRRMSPVLDKSEKVYRKYGVFAILLTRTVLSPCGPYIAYLCGVWGMNRAQYSVTALAGSSIWSSVYIMLGYSFAGNVPEISDLMRSVMLVTLAGLFTLGFGYKLAVSWKAFKRQLV
ncbi:DedA family protein [Leucothrix arctica]|uniref:VTT domain-containing protein n=1 Tax=Leucothrix arctica TaxID=1481894 RepID=A0A317CTI5_9GAMM|nr:DedA family protein [Leucothrix arctica]PWQ99622.1 hypothetical protein DKT75_00695 [Leucothrix arctica]